MGLTRVPQHSCGGQRAFMVVSSLFPASGSQGPNAVGHQAWQQAPLLTEIVLWPQK